MVKKILLAEDEDAVRALVGETIRDDSRYILLEARNGKEALEVAQREKPDLVLLDIVMPIYDGFEVCRQIKSDPQTKHIIVIMLSALAQESNRDMGKKVGADGYFTKPFSPSALIKRVDDVFKA